MRKFVLLIYLLCISLLLSSCTANKTMGNDSSGSVDSSQIMTQEETASSEESDTPSMQADEENEASAEDESLAEGAGLPLIDHPEYWVYVMDWRYETGYIYPGNSGLPIYPFWRDSTVVDSDLNIPTSIKVDGDTYHYESTTWNTANYYHIDRYVNGMELIRVERETGYYYPSNYPGFAEPQRFEFPPEENYTEDDPYGYYSITDPIAAQFLDISYFTPFYMYDSDSFQAISYEYQLGKARINNALSFRFDPPEGCFYPFGRTPSYLIAGLPEDLQSRLTPLAESLVSEEMKASLQKTLEAWFPDYTIHLSEPDDNQPYKHPTVILLPDGSLGVLYELRIIERITRASGYMYVIVVLAEPEVLFTMEDLLRASERAEEYYPRLEETILQTHAE